MVEFSIILSKVRHHSHFLWLLLFFSTPLSLDEPNKGLLGKTFDSPEVLRLWRFQILLSSFHSLQICFFDFLLPNKAVVFLIPITAFFQIDIFTLRTFCPSQYSFSSRKELCPNRCDLGQRVCSVCYVAEILE